MRLRLFINHRTNYVFTIITKKSISDEELVIDLQSEFVCCLKVDGVNAHIVGKYDKLTMIHDITNDHGVFEIGSLPIDNSYAVSFINVSLFNNQDHLEPIKATIKFKGLVLDDVVFVRSISHGNDSSVGKTSTQFTDSISMYSDTKFDFRDCTIKRVSTKKSNFTTRWGNYVVDVGDVDSLDAEYGIEETDRFGNVKELTTGQMCVIGESMSSLPPKHFMQYQNIGKIDTLNIRSFDVKKLSKDFVRVANNNLIVKQVNVTIRYDSYHLFIQDSMSLLFSCRKKLCFDKLIITSQLKENLVFKYTKLPFDDLVIVEPTKKTIEVVEPNHFVVLVALPLIDFKKGQSVDVSHQRKFVLGYGREELLNIIHNLTLLFGVALNYTQYYNMVIDTEAVVDDTDETILHSPPLLLRKILDWYNNPNFV